MSLLKNKKAVEGLPLKYIIIALVAALVVGIALQFTGTLRGGIQSTAETLNETLVTKTTCELDEEKPTITFNDNLTECTGGDITVNIRLKDACGVSSAGFADTDDLDTWYDLELKSGTIKDGVWEAKEDLGSCPSEIMVSVYDKATTPNQAKENYDDL